MMCMKLYKGTKQSRIHTVMIESLHDRAKNVPVKGDGPVPYFPVVPPGFP